MWPPQGAANTAEKAAVRITCNYNFVSIVILSAGNVLQVASILETHQSMHCASLRLLSLVKRDSLYISSAPQEAELRRPQLQNPRVRLSAKETSLVTIHIQLGTWISMRGYWPDLWVKKFNIP